MSTVQTWQTESTSSDNTLKLAAALGQKLKGGEVVELISDLGGGKTVFVKGMAKGMGVKDLVGSPTFTVSSQYKAGDLVLHHFDFYRLDEPGVISNELAETIGSPQNVVAVEWAELVDTVLPHDRLSIRIRAVDENKRHLIFTYPVHLEYLLPH